MLKKDIDLEILKQNTVYKYKIIDKSLKDCFDNIRITRNKAAHRNVFIKLNESLFL